MLDLVPDVGSCQVIIKTLDVVYDLNLCVILPFVFPFDEGFVQVVWRKWLDKGSHFLGDDFLRISGALPGIHKNRRRNGCIEDFGRIVFVLYVYAQHKVKLDAFIIIACAEKFDGREKGLAVHQLQFVGPSDAHVHEMEIVRLIYHGLHSEYVCVEIFGCEQVFSRVVVFDL